MPGLPRKSTAKQFKKLMKRSGKARTNKASGGSDPSTRRISTYEQFVNMTEAIRWYKDGKLEDKIETEDETETIRPYSSHVWKIRPLTFDDVEIGEVVGDDEITFIVTNKWENRINLKSENGSTFTLPKDKFKNYNFFMKHPSDFHEGY